MYHFQQFRQCLIDTEHPHSLHMIISTLFNPLFLPFQNFSTDHSVPPRKTHIRCAAVFLCYFEETDAHQRRLDAAAASPPAAATSRPLKAAFVRASAAHGSARSQLFAARSTVCRRTHNRKLSSPRRPLSIPCGQQCKIGALTGNGHSQTDGFSSR